MMDIEIVPCSVEQIEKLIEGPDAFQAVYGFQVVDGYLPFEGALQKFGIPGYRIYFSFILSKCWLE